MAYLAHTGELSELAEGPDVIWVYAFGEVNGGTVKFGKSKGATLRGRLRDVNRDQMTSDRYVLLAAVRGTPKDEDAIHDYFAADRIQKGTRTEYFEATPAVVEYAAWLSRGFWAVTDPDDEEKIMIDPANWLPTPDRRVPPPVADPSVLIQEWETRNGHLAGTAWAWMPDPKASFQDYFTPPEIVDAARVAMGSIDLDAASHWAANKVHRIADYFDVNKSAFENEWHGRVWLNPPYGQNALWFDRMIHQLDAGRVDQVCMLSPVWAFNTGIAAEVMSRVSGMILLTPTPTFWGNADGRTGTNNPHAIIYIGDRPGAFFSAFAAYGMPFSIPTVQVAAS
jgi:hypothetical protein